MSTCFLIVRGGDGRQERADECVGDVHARPGLRAPGGKGAGRPVMANRRHCEQRPPRSMAQQEGLESFVPACRKGDRVAQRDLLRYLRRTNVRGPPACRCARR